MTPPPCAADGRGLTGPHPNPLSSVILRQPCVHPVSLHRYAGRWIVVRVSEESPAPGEQIGSLAGIDWVSLNVISGPVTAEPAAGTGHGRVLFDPAAELAMRFPSLAWPATFVLDPDGRLIAILDDRGWPIFIEQLARRGGQASAGGAIDQQDIHL
jgi:hypothetical protein